MFRRYWNATRIYLRYQLGFSRSEFRGGLILILMVFCLSLYRLYSASRPMEAPDLSLLEEVPSEISQIEPLRSFNPDTVSALQLISWGMPEDIAKRWVKYRETVGGFNSISQINRIYGMPDSLFRSWQDSVILTKKAVGKFQRRCPEEMDLNYADSLMLMRLHGIGKVLSGRIIRYRRRLGGYIRVSQLREVYGLQDSTFAHIRDKLYIDDRFQPVQLLLDTVTYQQLYDHPYIHSKEATAILRYRRQHPGQVCLAEILAIDSMARLKMLPYVKETCSVIENERPE